MRVVIPLVVAVVLASRSGAAAEPPPSASDAEAGKAARVSSVYTPSAEAPIDSPLRGLGLKRASDGSYLYTDPHRRFTAAFQTDGTVLFADRWKRKDTRKPGKGRCCALPRDGLNPFTGMPFGGPLEWAIRAQGKDPLARDKAALLERTRELRTRLAIENTLQLIDTALARLDGELRAIWDDPDRTQLDRRVVLFERWDECEERFNVLPKGVPPEAISEMDAARVDAAERARRRIQAFIRHHAPRESERGYGREELEGLNRQRMSQTPFSPYTADSR